MDFSIVICTWNRSKALRETLVSFERLVGVDGSKWELLIVNNACTDDTDNVVAEFKGRLPVRRLYESRPGKSAALNCALKEFKGHILLFTDDDVVVGPEWVQVLLSAFRTHHADIVFGGSYPVWPREQPLWYGPSFRGQFAILDYGPQSLVVTTAEYPYYGLNVGFTRSAIEQLGPYREDLGYVGKKGGAGEDTEMFERALALGLKIVYEPNAHVGHSIPSERTTKKRQRQLAWQGARTNYLLVRERATDTPCLLRIPRYMYGLAMQDAIAMAKAFVQRQPSECFYREVRLWRFFGLINEALRTRRALTPS